MEIVVLLQSIRARNGYNEVSGKVVLRTRFMKAVDIGKKGRGVLFVADATENTSKDFLSADCTDFRRLFSLGFSSASSAD